MPSDRSATPSASAPFATKTRPISAAPWPYPSALITAKIFRSGPTSWRTARTFPAAASRSISRIVGLGGRDVSIMGRSSGEEYPDAPARHSGSPRFVLTSVAMATEITPAVRAELAPTGKLRIGLNHGNFLLVTPGSSATEPRGVASDIGRELGRRVGVPVEFIKFESAGKLGDSVRTGVWDVAFLGAE